MRRAITTVAAALGVAATVSACTPGKDTPRSHQSTSSTPSRTPGPPNAILGPGGLVSGLPDTCQAVERSLPAEMVSASLEDSFTPHARDFLECVWSDLGDKSARIFRYGIWQYPSLAQAHDQLNHLRHLTVFTNFSCRYKSADTKTVSSLGEEAFAVPCTYEKYDSNNSDNDHIYEVGGSNLAFRTRNVVIRVWWAKADYPVSETKKNPHWLRGGKQLAYKQALPQMTQVAKALLTHFPST